MFKATFSAPETFSAQFGSSESAQAQFAEAVEVPVGEYYIGQYEFTPTDEEETIHVEGLVAVRDIIVHAVPHTYGHISWNGAYLSVY